MKIAHAVAASTALVLATVSAHAASFTGQIIDGALSTDTIPGVTTQFISPIVAPGVFNGVIQDTFGFTWSVNVQVLSTEIVVGWTASDPNLSVLDQNAFITVDLSGFTGGPVLGLSDYSCTSSAATCDSGGGGPTVGALTSTATSFDASFDIVRSGETYTFGAAVPEPATWAMMSLGFAGLALGGFRARRSAAAIA